ncbi:MAG: serine/threonine protein kinase [Planctomycetota bacterium]|nr:MAG: serine/threonine protein kinase [Planctomycetota bacterium]
MDLMSDILRDFANRSRDELDLLDEGLSEWPTATDDSETLNGLAEILQSLQEMSGLLALPELESLFHHGHKRLLTVRQCGSHPCLEVIAELRELTRNGRRLLYEMESRSNDGSSMDHAVELIAPPPAQLIQPNGPPSPFRRRESLRGSANSLTDFIVENLADSHANSADDSTHMGTRLVRLIDEVMTARHQIRQVFAHAVSLKSQRERSAFLDQACAACPELRLSLERLLTSELHSQRLMQFPASELIRALLESLRSEMLPSASHVSPVGLTAPDDDVSDQDVESTVRVRPGSEFVPSVAEESHDDPAAFPRPFGRYTLERELGHGAMGTVFLASDRLLNRQVALKLLRMKPEDGQEVVERFYREARSMASLQHANLCPIYDFGEVDGQPYLTMAFINGRPLSDYLVGGRPLVTRYAVTLARTLAMALHQAHQMGIVHRDLKPANVMINKDAEPVLMDFGLARRQQPGEVELTQQGMILGSPAYMAPEQVEGKIDQIGPATDVHALGVILYEMLSGRKPFDGTVASVLAQIQSKPAEPLRIPGDTEGRLDAICRRAMAKAMSRRYASALDFANALTEYLEDANRVRLTSEVDLTPDTETVKRDSAADSAARTTQTWIHPERIRRRWRWAIAAAMVIGITVATIKLNSRNTSGSNSLKVGSTDTLRESR